MAAAGRSVAGAYDLVAEAVEHGQLVGGEGKVGGGDVLLQPLAPLGAGDRDHADAHAQPLALAKHPGQMPGGIRTRLQRYVTEAELDRMRAAAGGGGPSWKNAGQGAATSVLAAASPLLDGVGGRYFEDGQEAGLTQPGTRTGVAAYALDTTAAAMAGVRAAAGPVRQAR